MGDGLKKLVKSLAVYSISKQQISKKKLVKSSDIQSNHHCKTISAKSQYGIHIEHNTLT